MRQRHPIPESNWREVGYLFVNGEILRIERRGGESRAVRLESI
ncbi:MAG TPA: hypothetical protein VND70_00335 [Acidimicrobiales bacterium]|nr:hypothetical protein [Acidimicrobiales bacterium]